MLPRRLRRRRSLRQKRIARTFLHAVPDGQKFSTIRKIYLARIAEAKSAIAKTKPIGAQIDGCTEPFRRAFERQTDAGFLVAVALETRELANREVARYIKELEELDATRRL